LAREISERVLDFLVIVVDREAFDLLGMETETDVGPVGA